MPVTKTAKRALRVSHKKTAFNSKLNEKLEIALRMAKKKPTDKNISTASSIIDRAAKKNLIHKNKAARIKSQLSRKAPKTTSKAKVKVKKK